MRQVLDGDIGLRTDPVEVTQVGADRGGRTGLMRLALPAPTTEKQPMDGSFQEAITRALHEDRRRTSARITALSRDLQDIIERSNDASRDDEHDPEGATIAFERAQVRALLDAAEARLQQLDAAEQRWLATGEFGRCEACGAAIHPERLLARPTARACVECATGPG